MNALCQFRQAKHRSRPRSRACAEAQRRFGQRPGGMQHVLPCWQDRGAGALLLWVSMDRLNRLTLSCEPGSGHVHSALEVRMGGTCRHLCPCTGHMLKFCSLFLLVEPTMP